MLSQSCLVILNLWGPLRVALKRKKLSQCGTKDCQSLTKTGASTIKVFSVWQQWHQIRHHHGYKLSFQDWRKVELFRRKHEMDWFSIPLCPPGGLDSNKFDATEDIFHIQVKEEFSSEDWPKCFASKILDANHKRTDVVEVVKGPTHLNAHQKADLLWMLQENNKIFDGTLGVYLHKKVHIDIDPNAKPVHSRPYPVPRTHLKTFKMELDHLVRVGVLASQQESEWAPPSLIIPKKGWQSLLDQWLMPNEQSH